MAEDPGLRDLILWTGSTVFYIRSGESLWTFAAAEATLGEGGHALSDFFYKAHELITAIRTTSSPD